ncbi:tetratricopeptide repeat protein [Candidatus Dependentiae bacterium]
MRRLCYTLIMFILTAPLLATTTAEIDKIVATGAQLKKARKYEKAITAFKQALTIAPQHPSALGHLAACYIMVGEIEKAFSTYRALLKINPKDNKVLYNIACTLKIMGMMHEAASLYEKVIAIDPDYHMAHIGLAKAYLATGNFKRGWEEFEWRYDNPKKFRQPKRDLAEFVGKKVLVRSEWGLGDTMQFFRYTQLLKQAGATVIVETFAPLIQLFSLCDYVDLVTNINEKTKPGYDIQIPMLSLPMIFDTTEETIPINIPYLQADQNLVDYWHKQLKTSEPVIKIGLCWQAKQNIFVEKQPRTRRSILLQQFAPLAQVDNVVFYSLQQQNGIDQLDNLPEGFIVQTFDTDFDKTHGRFMDSAAVIKNLDLVISVDTSIVHLAGALGTDVWVLLPHSAEWRWMLNRSDTPWYPNMRLFRQPKPGDWLSVINNIKHALEQFAEKRIK